MEKSGIKSDRIISSINNLAAARDTLNNYIQKVEKSVINDSELTQDLIDYCDELNQNSEFKILPIVDDLSPKDKGRLTVKRQKQKEVEQHHDWKKEEYKDMPGKGKNDAGRADEFLRLEKCSSRYICP